MDPRLPEAARSGDTVTLLALLAENPDVLDDVAPTTRDSLLHIAAKYGKHLFVRVILCHRPLFARELNKNGYSPLHLASANGHVDTVRELLNVRHNLCLLMDRDGMIPLHFATIKGRLNIINALLSSCPESAQKLTIRGETVLHLAVMNNQCETFRILVYWLKQHNQGELVNWKDNRGNTVLHLATSIKQFQILQFLLASKTTTGLVLQVNTLNSNGCTALDLLLQSPNDSDDREIGEILRRAGAITAKDIGQTAVRPLAAPMLRRDPHSGVWATFYNELWQVFDQCNEVLCCPVEWRNVLLVVVILIVTVTFQNVGNPSDCIRPESSKPNSRRVPVTHYKIGDVLGFGRHSLDYYFMTMNTATFIVSIGLIPFLISSLPLRRPILFILFSVVIDYALSMAKTMPGFIVVCGSFHITSYLLVWLGVFAYIFTTIIGYLVYVWLSCFTRVTLRRSNRLCSEDGSGAVNHS